MTASTKKSLMGIVAESIDKYPNHVAVVLDDGNTKSCITYQELRSQSDKISDVLRCHKAEGTVVGVCLDPSIHLPSIILGILKTQSIFFPFSTDGKDFISKALSSLKVSWILTLSEKLIEVEEIIRNRKSEIIHSVELAEFNLVLVALDIHVENPYVNNLDLAYIITTSGSTSVPKLVSVPNSSIVPNILTLRKKYKVSVKDVVLMASPLTFDPSIVDIFVTLSSGACLLIVPEIVKRMPHLFIAITTQRNHITILQATPSLLYQFNPDDLKTSLFAEESYLRVLAIGGEDFPPISVLKTWIHKPCNLQIYNLYGITEVSCWSNCYRVSKEDFRLDLPNVPIGEALAETQVKVTDHHGNILNEGEGQLWIGSDSRVCFIDEEMNEKNIRRDGDIVWRETGDIVKIFRNRQILYLYRQDTQIKRHGKRINLASIEKVVSKVIDIKQSVAVYHEEKIYLFLSIFISSYGEEEKLRKSVSLILLSHLPSYYQPNQIFFLEYFPVTKHGKIDKNALIGKLKSKPLMKVEIPSRSCELAVWLKQKWHDILDLVPLNSKGVDEEINEDSNFILLGGSSLKAIQLASDLEVYLCLKHPQILDLLLNKTFKHVHRYVLNIINQFDHRDKSLCNVHDIKNHSRNILRSASPNVDIEKMNHFPIDMEWLDSHNRHGNSTKNFECSNQISSKAEIAQHSELKMEECQCVTFDLCASEREMNMVDSLESTKDYTSKNIECSQTSVSKRKLDSYFDESKVKLSKSKDETCECFIGFVTRGSQYFRCIVNQSNHSSFNGHNHDTVASTSSSKLSESFSKCADYTNPCIQSKSIKNMTYIKSSSINEIIGHDDKSQMIIPFNKHRIQNDLKDSQVEIQKGPHHARCFHRYSCEEGLKLKMDWKHNTGKCVDSSPIVGIRNDKKKVVFIGSHSHKFSALQVETGHILWNITLPDRIESSPIFSKCGQLIAVGCYDGCLYVMNAHTGSIHWSLQTGNSIKCSPVLDMATGLVLFGSHDGNIYAVDLSVKQCRWKVNLSSGSVFSSPCIKKAQVYVATLGGVLFSLNIESGDIMWRCQLQKPVFGSVVCFTDCLIVPSVDGIINAISFQGEKVWSYQTRAPIFSSPTICHIHNHGDCVLIGSHDNHLYCLNNHGQLVWSYNASHPIYSTSFVFHYEKSWERSNNETTWEKFINVTSVPDQKCDCMELYGNNRSNTSNTRIPHSVKRCHKFKHGLLKESDCSNFNSKQKIYNRPKGDFEDMKICNVNLNFDVDSEKDLKRLNYLAIASTIGELSIIDLQTGKVKVKHRLNGEVFSSPLIIGNKILVGCRDDYLYCFHLH